MSREMSASKRGPLSKARIASLKPYTDKATGKKKPVDAFDAVSKAAVAGLLVRCQPSGRKYFYYQYRRPAYVKNRGTGEEVLNNNASTRVCLGLVDDISINAARDKARKVRDAAKAAKRAGLTGNNVTAKVHQALNNLHSSVDKLEGRQEAKRICPTVLEFIDSDYVEEQRDIRKLKSFQDGREIQRLKYVLAVLSQPPKKGPDAGKKGDPQFNLLSKKLDEIDGKLIRKWKILREQRASDRSGVRPSDVTVARELMMIRSMFKVAIKCGYIDENPADGCSGNVTAEREVVPLTERQVQQLQQVLINREDRLRKQRKSVNEFAAEEGGRVRPEIPDDEYADYLRPIILLAMHTGLRFGELADLTWDNVTLRRSKSSGDHSKLTIPNPKNKKKHVAPLNDFAEGILLKWRKSRRKIGPNVLVFPDSKGRRLVGIRRNWVPVFAEAGLPKGYRFHDLRHEYASKLAQKGVPLAALQKLMNHSSPKMVQKYVDFHPDWMKETVGKLTEDDEWIV